LICVTWFVHMCDMTMCVTWPVSAMTRWSVWHDSLIRVTWLVDMCDMTRSCACLSSLIRICMYTRMYVYTYVCIHICMYTYMYTYICMYTHMYTYIWTCNHVHTFSLHWNECWICIHIRKNTHTCIHTHICTHFQRTKIKNLTHIYTFSRQIIEYNCDTTHQCAWHDSPQALAKFGWLAPNNCGVGSW